MTPLQLTSLGKPVGGGRKGAAGHLYSRTWQQQVLKWLDFEERGAKVDPLYPFPPSPSSHFSTFGSEVYKAHSAHPQPAAPAAVQEPQAHLAHQPFPASHSLAYIFGTSNVRMPTWKIILGFFPSQETITKFSKYSWQKPSF